MGGGTGMQGAGGSDEARPPLPRVEIRVRDPGGCPVLAAGDRMIYAHPEILKSESGRICAQALSTAAPVAEEVARAAAQGRRLDPLEIHCPAEGCGAVLVVAAIPDGGPASTGYGSDPAPESGSRDAIAPREPAPAAARSPGKGRPPSRRGGLETQVGRLSSPMTGGGPFLSRLDPDTIEEIVELSDVVHYDEPTVIIREEQQGEALYVIAEGEVEVVRDTGGREIRLALVGKGECLGEMSLLTGQPASATVRTRGEDAVVLALPKTTLEAILVRRPTLHREFSRIIAQRLYSTNVRLDANSSRGISGSLSMIGVVDLIQTLHASRRTGTLALRDGRGVEARVGLAKGSVSSAMVGDVPGAEGFFDLLRWGDGTFSFEGGDAELDSDPSAAIQGDTMALLMEGLRRLDEGDRE